jgi:uncharacterized protein (TIGR04255 family)
MSKPSRKLSSPPLIEVIFEVRWKLPTPADAPSPFRGDPGYPLFADKFATLAARRGFRNIESVGAQTGLPFTLAYSVSTRFRKSGEQPFPLIQIGPGLFAANDSGSGYEWQSFRAMALASFGDVLESYPQTKSFKLAIDRLELRYRNVFAPPVISSTDFYEFVDKHTHLQVRLDPFLQKLRTRGQSDVSWTHSAKLSSPRKGRFNVVLGTATTNGEPSILLETVFRTDAKSVNLKSTSALKDIGKLLDDGHGLSSPFFEAFIRPELLERLR